MDPARLAEPRALAATFTLFVAIAAVLGFTVGIGSPPARDQPVVLSPEGAPTIAQGDAAWRACRAAGADAGCLIYVLERTRSVSRMPRLARRYVRLVP